MSKLDLQVGQVFIDIEQNTLHRLMSETQFRNKTTKYVMSNGQQFLSNALTANTPEKRFRTIHEFINLNNGIVKMGSLIRVDQYPELFLEKVVEVNSSVVDYKIKS